MEALAFTGARLDNLEAACEFSRKLQPGFIAEKNEPDICIGGRCSSAPHAGAGGACSVCCSASAAPQCSLPAPLPPPNQHCAAHNRAVVVSVRRLQAT